MAKADISNRHFPWEVRGVVEGEWRDGLMIWPYKKLIECPTLMFANFETGFWVNPLSMIKPF